MPFNWQRSNNQRIELWVRPSAVSKQHRQRAAMSAKAGRTASTGLRVFGGSVKTERLTSRAACGLYRRSNALDRCAPANRIL